MPRGARYQAEFKDEAVRLYQTSGKGFREIAEGLGIAPETLRPPGSGGRDAPGGRAGPRRTFHQASWMA